jgi:tetratricopeptide (TPR) repeat protein
MNRSPSRILAIPLALFLLSALVVGCATPEERRARHKENAWSFYEEENYEKARVEFMNALKMDKTDSEARYGAGLAFRRIAETDTTLPLADRQNMLRTSAGHLLAAVEQDPSHLEARVEFSDLRLRVFGDAAGALDLAEQAVRLDPRSADALAARAAALQVAGERDRAREDAERALAIDPVHPEAVAVRAAQLAGAGDTQAALAMLRAAVQQGDAQGELRLVLANLLLSEGSTDEAVAEMREVIRLNPESVSLRQRLAAVLAQLGRLNEAEKAFRDAVRVADDTRTRLALIEFLRRFRSEEAAEEELRSLIEAMPEELELRYALARLQYASDRPAEADATLRDVIERDREDGRWGLDARTLLAERLLAREQTTPAEALISEVLDVNPRDSDGLRLRGLIHLQRGDYSAAVGDLRAALRDEPSSLRILRPLATAYYRNGDRSLARDALATATDVDPRNFEVRLATAQLALEQEDAETAIEALEAALEIDPASARAVDLLVGVLLQTGDVEEAGAVAQAFANDNPEQPMGPFLAGMAARRAGDDAQAEALLRRALELAPGTAEPLSMLVQLLVEAERMEDVSTLLEETLDERPGNALALQLLARTRMATGDEAGAAELYERLKEVAPASSAPYTGLALIEARNQDLEGAAEIMAEGWQAAPDARLGLDYALLLERLGRFEAAEDIYEQMLGDDPDNAVAANNLAMLLLRREGDRGALDRALELAEGFEDSDNGAFLDTLGWVHVLRSEPDQAVPVLRRAVERAPGLGVIRYHLAEALARSGREGEAREVLDGALDERARGAWVEQATALRERLGSG